MVGIGCDHGGLEIKNVLAEHLKEKGYDVRDFGTYDKTSVDYPDIAKAVCTEVKDGNLEFAVLVCGTGIGMSMAANKVKGIRAAVCSDAFSAEFTRRHNDANVLCIGARVLAKEKALKLVDIFLESPFDGGKHKTRIDMFIKIQNSCI